MLLRGLKQKIGSATRSFPKAGALSVHHSTPRDPPTSLRNIEYDTIVVVYKVKEILHRPAIDNPIRVREVVDDPVLRSVGLPKSCLDEDPPGDYLRMLSSKFPESDLLPKVHHR